MDKRNILGRLEELFQIPEVREGFPSQEACLTWANRVAPLLRFNRQYHLTFLYYLQIISRNVSSYTAEPALRTMLSQVEMAIEELKIDIESEEQTISVAKEEPQAKATILKLEPNIYGIGVNLPELWKRIKARLGRKKT